jgi:hypothetical protein
MYHIVLRHSGLSICQWHHQRCEYNTRREAFAQMLKLEKIHGLIFTLIEGPCHETKVNP